MKIVRRPKALKSIAFLVFGLVPLVLLNLWVIQNGLGVREVASRLDALQITGAITLVIALSTFRLLYFAKKLSILFLATIALFVLGANVYFVFKTKNYALAFYGLFFVITAGIYISTVFKCLKEVYYASGKQWFEGAPPFIPGVDAFLFQGDTVIPTKLSRIAFEGCFAFSDDKISDKIDKVSLRFSDIQVDLPVFLVTRTKDQKAGGIKFAYKSLDEAKEVHDFIDRVRSWGYVD